MTVTISIILCAVFRTEFSELALRTIYYIGIGIINVEGLGRNAIEIVRW
jgi:hypothetical protein